MWVLSASLIQGDEISEKNLNPLTVTVTKSWKMQKTETRNYQLRRKFACALKIQLIDDITVLRSQSCLWWWHCVVCHRKGHGTANVPCNFLMEIWCHKFISFLFFAVTTSYILRATVYCWRFLHSLSSSLHVFFRCLFMCQRCSSIWAEFISELLGFALVYYTENGRHYRQAVKRLLIGAEVTGYERRETAFGTIITSFSWPLSDWWLVKQLSDTCITGV